jgi:hypothetical protein
MKVLKQKTVRFAELVKHSGKPELAILWTEPEKDAAFWRAVKEKRVVTILQQTAGGKKDHP